LGSPASIEEDFHFARESQGLLGATADDLKATTTLLDVFRNFEDSDAALTEARDMLALHTRAMCRRKYDAQSSEACARAGALSLERLLCRERESQDAGIIRRQVLRSEKCHITEGALRKREDALMKQIAAAVWRDLQARREDMGAWSLDEFVYYLSSIFRPVRVTIRNAVALINDGNEGFIPGFSTQLPRSLLSASRVQLLAYLLAKTLEGRRSFRRKHLRAESLFHALAHWIHTFPIISQSDYASLTKFCARHWEPAPEHELVSDNLLAQFMKTRGSKSMVTRYAEWLGSCPNTCMYERTMTFTGLCDPHRFSTLIQLFLDASQDLSEGDPSTALTRYMPETLTLNEIMREWKKDSRLDARASSQNETRNTFKPKSQSSADPGKEATGRRPRKRNV
jgi:hypothetical protein